MTITKYAESKGVSRQAVYNAIRKAGKKTCQFTDSKGQLTEQGISELDDLITDKASKPNTVNYQSILQENRQEIDRLLKRVEELSKTNETLTQTVDNLSRTLETQTENLKAAQQLHARDLLRLEAVTADREKDQDPKQPPVPVDPAPDLSTFAKRLKFVFSSKKKGD